MTGVDTAPPLTVAHVIHSLGAGGAESMLTEFAAVAGSAELRVVVVGLSDARNGADVDNRIATRLRELGATVYEMHAGRYDPRAAIRLATVLKSEQVEVVHTHLKHADIVGGVAARLAGVPTLSTLHVIDAATSVMQRLRVRAAVIARRTLAGTVIVLSEAQRRWYTDQAGPGVPIRLLPNGINRSKPRRSRAAIRSEIGVADDVALALCASLMRPEKGHADLLDALRGLPAELPLVVALAGDGPLFDDIASTVATDPALNARTRVLGYRHDIADLLAGCDFVIQPSREDALPTALISALAAGKPIVGTDVGGIPDIAAPGCGTLVQAQRPAELRDAIEQMTTTVLGDDAAVARYRRATRDRYRECFSAEVWVTALRREYERAIGTRLSSTRRFALVEFPPAGGLYQFALQLGEGLARAGRRVEVITGPNPELDSREPGCDVVSILPTWHPAGGAAVPEWLRRLRRITRGGRHIAAWSVLIVYLSRTRPDVVLWSAWRFPIDGWGVRVVRRVLPRAVLGLVAHEPRPLTEQPGADGLYKSSRITTGAFAAAYAELDVAFVLGESARAALTDLWPIRAEVHVIPHGDEGILASAPIGDASGTDPVVLAFGTITAYKGIDTLCRAWPLVRAEVPDARLVIAGAVSADVDAAGLRSEALRLPGVDLRMGYVPVDDVAGYFARARCVVLPYKRGSQSGVAHLAHTMGRPVVATRVGDIPDVVDDEVSGLLVEPECPHALARALVRLLKDPATAGRLGAQGARNLGDRASWDEVAARLEKGLPPVAVRR